MNDKREFIFEIKEIRKRHNPKMPDGKEDFIFVRTGIVSVDGDDIAITVDDDSQPYKMFEVKDNFFKKIIRKIHQATNLH